MGIIWVYRQQTLRPSVISIIDRTMCLSILFCICICSVCFVHSMDLQAHKVALSMGRLVDSTCCDCPSQILRLRKTSWIFGSFFLVYSIFSWYDFGKSYSRLLSQPQKNDIPVVCISGSFHRRRTHMESSRELWFSYNSGIYIKLPLLYSMYASGISLYKWW